MIKKVPFLQLTSNLGQLKKSSCPHALLVGNDPYLIELSLQQLKQTKKSLNQDPFLEQFEIELNAQTDWQAIFNSFYTDGLFESQKLFIFRFNSANINATLQKNLTQLVQQVSSNCTVIFIFTQSSKMIEQYAFFKALTPLWLISCSVFDAVQLKQWLTQKLIQLKLTMEQSAIDRLLYYYEGNLYALSQLLEQIALLYPNQSELTLSQLESLLNDEAQFTPFHWIDAILARQPKRAIHVLQQLKKEDFEPLILIRIYQKELLQWTDLKKRSLRFDLNTLFNEFKIWQSRRGLLTTYLNSIQLINLYDLVSELAQIEIGLKTSQEKDIWLKLAQFTLKLTDCSALKIE